MFEVAPSGGTLSSFGLKPSDWEQDEPVYAWPDNAQAVRIFRSVSTQWRSGPGGPFALDYNPLFSLMSLQGLSPDCQVEIFDKVRVMEVAAINVLLKGRGNGSRNVD